MRQRSQHPSGSLRRAFQAVMALTVLSTINLVRGYTLPEQVSEPAFAYEQALAFDFTARVAVGQVYRNPLQTPRDLVKFRLSEDPPAFRHVLVSRYLEELELRIRYSYSADRLANSGARLRIRSTLIVPRLWQEEDPLRVDRELSSGGRSLSGEERILIPAREIFTKLRSVAAEAGVNTDQAELRLRPEFEVTVPEHGAFVARLAPEYVLVFRNGGILELDEPKTFREEKSIGRPAPERVAILGASMTVQAWRALSTILELLLLLLSAVIWMLSRMRKARRRGDRPARLQRRLERLGPDLVVAAAFEPREGLAVADLTSIDQMLRVHLVTDQPVIRVGNICYLVSDDICYRLVLPN